MKVPAEVLLEILQIMSDEELIRFRKRLEMKIGQKLRKDARVHLTEILTAELKRRKANGEEED